MVLIKNSKSNLKEQFYFRFLKFNFKFGEIYERMRFDTYLQNPKASLRERKQILNEQQNNYETSNLGKEAISINKLKEILNDTNLDLEIIGLEGFHVDIAVRKKTEHKWFPIQMKATGGGRLSFSMNKRYYCPFALKNNKKRYNYYEYMLLICYNITDDKFLLIMPHTKGIIDSSFRFSKGVNNGFYVDVNDISKRINEYIDDNENLGKTIEELKLLCTEEKQLEMKYVQIRLEQWSKIFNMTELESCATDFIIDDCIKIQEKTRNSTDINENSFQFILDRNNDGCKHQTYYIKDNDFYLFNLNNTDIFYIIPAARLLEVNGYISKFLTLHKEFRTEEDNQRWRYYDSWTYEFRFDRTKPEDMLSLWCLIYDF